MNTLLVFVQGLVLLPRQLWAPLLGLLAAWGLTQRLKFLLPSSWSPKAREVSTQSLAFVIGWITTGLVWGPHDPLGWTVGFAAGLAAPAIWNVGMLVLGWWKPELAKLLSQNIRKDTP